MIKNRRYCTLHCTPLRFLRCSGRFLAAVVAAGAVPVSVSSAQRLTRTMDSLKQLWNIRFGRFRFFNVQTTGTEWRWR
jgi:hypothetical protein